MDYDLRKLQSIILYIAKEIKRVCDKNEDNDLLNQMGILFDATFDIRSTKDLANAFEYDQNHTLGKTILHWEM